MGIIGGSVEKGILGTDLPADVMPVHITIPLQCYQLCEARAAGAARLVATAMQRGGDMDGPMCSSSSMKTMNQARYSESSSAR